MTSSLAPFRDRGDSARQATLLAAGMQFILLQDGRCTFRPENDFRARLGFNCGALQQIVLASARGVVELGQFRRCREPRTTRSRKRESMGGPLSSGENDATRTVRDAGGKNARRTPPPRTTIKQTDMKLKEAIREARQSRPRSRTRFATGASHAIRKVTPASPVTARSCSSGRSPLCVYASEPQLPCIPNPRRNCTVTIAAGNTSVPVTGRRRGHQRAIQPHRGAAQRTEMTAMKM